MNQHSRINQCRSKARLCIRNARRNRHEASNPDNTDAEKREFAQMADEAINDVCGFHWWRSELRLALEKSQAAPR